MNECVFVFSTSAPIRLASKRGAKAVGAAAGSFAFMQTRMKFSMEQDESKQ